MLLLFKRNDVLGFAILVFVAFVLRMAYFVNPPAISELGDFYTNTFGKFNWLQDMYVAAPRLYIFLSAIFWIGVSVYFKQALVNLRLVPHRDFVPAIALVLVTSALPPFMILSVAGLAAVSIFVALTLVLGTPYNKTSRSRYFTIGAFLGIAIILYWPCIFLFIAALFILLSIRLFVLQEVVALILGTVFPVYLVWALYYIFSGHVFNPSNLAISFTLPVAIQYKSAAQVFIFFVILMAFYGIYISRNNISGNKIQLIKKWNGVLMFFILSLMAGISTKIFPLTAFVIALVPFSIILSSALTNNHKKYNTFTFYFVLVVVLSLQWVLRFV